MCFKKIGKEKYHEIQSRKEEILNYLLDSFNNGRKKTYFLIAVNLFELDELEEKIIVSNIMLWYILWYRENA